MAEYLIESTGAVSVPCRVCAGQRNVEFHANGFRWLRCRACKSTQKILSRQEYFALNPTYDPGLYLDGRDPGEVRQFLGVEQKQVLLRRVADRYIRTPGEQRALLDVGCGMGGYLLAGRELGFDVQGFEPSESHSRVAKQLFGLPVIPDYFRAGATGGRSFDLVVLSHVIEHIFDQKEFLNGLVDVLKPGGALLVITPNSGSLLAGLTRGFWPMLKPVDHVTMISAAAYEHFDLAARGDVYHWGSEYPFEFSATVLGSLRDAVNTLRDSRKAAADAAQNANASAVSPVRSFGWKPKLVRGLLTLTSLPMHGLAVLTGRQACLNTVIVRKA